MSNNVKEGDNVNDNEEDISPKDIKSRIKVFELNSTSTPPSSILQSNQIDGGGGVGGGKGKGESSSSHSNNNNTNRISVPFGKYDPLQAMSSNLPSTSTSPSTSNSPATSSRRPGTGTGGAAGSITTNATEPIIIKPSLRSRTPSASSSTLTPTAYSSNNNVPPRPGSSGPSTRVQLPGLGDNTKKLPGAAATSPERPIKPSFLHSTSSSSATSPSSFSSGLNTASNQDMKPSTSQNRPIPATKPASLASPTSATSTPFMSSSSAVSKGDNNDITPSPISSGTIPSIAPRLPMRTSGSGNEEAKAGTSTFSPSIVTNTSLTNEPESISNSATSLSSSTPPPLPGNKPVPSSTNSSYNINDNTKATSAATTLTAPSSVPAPKLPPRKQQSTSSTSTSVSISTSSDNGRIPPLPQRSGTISSSSSLDVQSQRAQPPPLASRPVPTPTLVTARPTSTVSSAYRNTPGQNRPQSTAQSPMVRTLPPPPTRDRDIRPTIPIPVNGSLASSSVNGPKVLKRYEVLWERLVVTFVNKNDNSSTPVGGLQSSISLVHSGVRLDGLIVREVWKLSKLDDRTLGRIWSQCDVNRQGSLDKTAFCKGLSLIDSELSRRSRGHQSR